MMVYDGFRQAEAIMRMAAEVVGIDKARGRVPGNLPRGLAFGSNQEEHEHY
jgi:hypothetical protein